MATAPKPENQGGPLGICSTSPCAFFVRSASGYLQQYFNDICPTCFSDCPLSRWVPHGGRTCCLGPLSSCLALARRISPHGNPSQVWLYRSIREQIRSHQR